MVTQEEYDLEEAELKAKRKEKRRQKRRVKAMLKEEKRLRGDDEEKHDDFKEEL